MPIQKYVIAKFLEPIADGTEFDAKSWPLHVTLAANFVVDRKSAGLFEKRHAVTSEGSMAISRQTLGITHLPPALHAHLKNAAIPTYQEMMAVAGL